MKELELLCSMKEVSFDGNDLENMVLSLRLVPLLTLKLASPLGAQNTAGPVLASFFVLHVHQILSYLLVSLQLFFECSESNTGI